MRWTQVTSPKEPGVVAGRVSEVSVIEDVEELSSKYEDIDSVILVVFFVEIGVVDARPLLEVASRCVSNDSGSSVVNADLSKVHVRLAGLPGLCFTIGPATFGKSNAKPVVTMSPDWLRVIRKPLARRVMPLTPTLGNSRGNRAE